MMLIWLAEAVLAIDVALLLWAIIATDRKVAELRDSFDSRQERDEQIFLELLRQNRELSEKIARIEKWANGDWRLDANDESPF